MDALEKVHNETSTPNKMELQYLKKITNQFSMDQIIGRGGFGTVYKGEDENGKVLAVKMLKNMDGMDDKQFLNEVKLVMDISHPNIVRPEGYCYHMEIELMPYNASYVFVDKVYRLLCFEYLPRGSLDKYITDESLGLDWYTRYNIIKGISMGLHCLHENRRDGPILHLDLKPANVLLDKDMVPKIADFGQSRLFGEGKTHMYTAKLIGSLGYMAPEYIEGRMAKESDIFSLGVIIMEIVTGDRKYPETTTAQDLFETHEKWGRRFQEKSNKMPYEKYCQQVNQCIEVAMKCMERDPKKRPNISEIIQILGTTEDLNSRALRDGSEVEEESREMVPPEWRGALDIVSLCSPEQSIEGIEVICQELCRIGETKSIMPEYIIKNTDKLVSYLTVLVRRTFNLILSGVDSRSCKYTLDILKRTFQARHLANAVMEETLENLIKELLTWCAVYCCLEMSEVKMLLDEGIKVEFLAHETNTYKLVQKIVDNVEQASLFMVLIKILMKPLDPSRWPSCASLVPVAEKSYHYSRLVSDILGGMSMDLVSSTALFDLDPILQSIHSYLQQVGMKEILFFKERMVGIDENSEAETRVTLQYGLRAVMKILEKLVEVKGSDVKHHLSMVPVYADPQPMIVAFIDLFLEKHHKDEAHSSDDEEEQRRGLVPPEIREALDIVEWCEALDIVALCSPEKSIRGMEVICHELEQMTNTTSIVPEYIIKDADRLVSYLTIMVEKTTKSLFSGADSSSFKCILDTLDRTFRFSHLCHALKEATLENLIRELLILAILYDFLKMDDVNILPDTEIKNKFLAQEKCYEKAVDRLWTNLEVSTMVVVLMNLVTRPWDSTRWPLCLSLMPLDEKYDEYSKFICSFLSEFAEVTSSTRHIDVGRIVQNINTCLQLRIEMQEIQTIEELDGDPVAKVIAQVLRKLVQLQGSVIKDHLDDHPQPIIVAFIDSALKEHASQGYGDETDSGNLSDGTDSVIKDHLDDHPQPIIVAFIDSALKEHASQGYGDETDSGNLSDGTDSGGNF